MKLHTIPFHMGDWMGGTIGWDALECGAYWNLCIAHYQAGESGLPNDERELAKLAKCSLKVWKRISPKILTKFTQNETSIVQRTCVDVLRKLSVISAQNSAKALKKQGHIQAVAQPQHNSGTAIHKPEAISQNPITKEKKEVLSGVVQKAPLPPSPQYEFLDEVNFDQIPSKQLIPLALKFELPEPWGMDMEALGWRFEEIVTEAEKFRQYYVSGKEAGKRRTVKGWRQSWTNWMGNAARWKK